MWNGSVKVAVTPVTVTPCDAVTGGAEAADFCHTELPPSSILLGASCDRPTGGSVTVRNFKKLGPQAGGCADG